MTHEFAPPRAFGGPKNYASRVVDTVTGTSKNVCKMWDTSFIYNASKLVNFVVIREMILKGHEPSVINIHPELKIKRRRKGDSSQMSPNSRTKSTGFRFLRGVVYATIRPPRLGINREGERGSCHNPLSSLSNYDLKFKHPFSCIVSGPSNSGKSPSA